jgi:hypothetical protein
LVCGVACRQAMSDPDLEFEELAFVDLSNDKYYVTISKVGGRRGMMVMMMVVMMMMMMMMMMVMVMMRWL